MVDIHCSSSSVGAKFCKHRIYLSEIVNLQNIFSLGSGKGEETDSDRKLKHI